MFEKKKKSNADLRNLINSYGLSQKELAKKLNVDQTVLSRTLRYELAKEEKIKFIDEIKKVVK